MSLRAYALCSRNSALLRGLLCLSRKIRGAIGYAISGITADSLPAPHVIASTYPSLQRLDPKP